MSAFRRLGEYLVDRGISMSVVEFSLKINRSQITESNAQAIQDNLTAILEGPFFEDEFCEVARAHGVDNETIAIISKIESSPSVMRMFKGS